MKANNTMKILREAKGFSQDYVGRVLGIEQNTYSKLENGQIRLTADRIHKLAQLYNISPDLLIGDELPMVNFNTGKFSKGIVNAENYTQTYSTTHIKEIISLKDEIIREKDIQIADLKLQLEEKKTEISFWKEFNKKEGKP